jgi:hypothetical protein
MLRPIQISKSFNLAVDALTCLWGGLIAPNICGTELKAKLATFSHLISFKSSFAEDTHLSKENYFNICASHERLKEVGNHACCMVAVFAFESLKNDQKYDKIKNETTVKYLRHLRNGAAHGNSFNFIDSRSKKIIDPGLVEWRGKIIDKSLQNKTVFPDFFAQGDFAYLFEDISKLLV